MINIRKLIHGYPDLQSPDKNDNPIKSNSVLEETVVSIKVYFTIKEKIKKQIEIVSVSAEQDEASDRVSGVSANNVIPHLKTGIFFMA